MNTSLKTTKPTPETVWALLKILSESTAEHREIMKENEGTAK